jgi:myo-inositol 2-dehydrogenase / D-chiro-inositol 1-dehydrogenase
LFDENGLSNVFTFKTDKYPHFINRFREGYFNEDQAFVECVLQDRQPSVSGKDGLAALKISFAALESSRTGSIVTL